MIWNDIMVVKRYPVLMMMKHSSILVRRPPSGPTPLSQHPMWKCRDFKSLQGISYRSDNQLQPSLEGLVFSWTIPIARNHSQEHLFEKKIANEDVNKERRNSKKKMSQEEFQEARKAVYVPYLYEDITSVNLRPSKDCETVSKDEDWPSIGSDLEEDFLLFFDKVGMDRFFLHSEEEVMFEFPETRAFSDIEDCAKSSTSVTETVILKTTKMTMYNKDGST